MLVHARLLENSHALVAGALLVAVTTGACGDGTRGFVLVASNGARTPVDAGATNNPPSDAGLSAVCSPGMTFENRDQAGSGRLFTELIPDPPALMLSVTNNVCAILYRTPEQIPVTEHVHLIVQDFDGVGSVSGVQGVATLRLSSRHMQLVHDSGGDLFAELTGILYFHGANIYQHSNVARGDEWVVQGVANFVRERAGYLPLSRRPSGGSYRDGFAHSGFFFAWLEERRPGFVYALNQSLAPGPAAWSSAVFQALAGSDIDSLWSEYQSTL